MDSAVPIEVVVRSLPVDAVSLGSMVVSVAVLIATVILWYLQWPRQVQLLLKQTRNDLYINAAARAVNQLSDDSHLMQDWADLVLYELSQMTPTAAQTKLGELSTIIGEVWLLPPRIPAWLETLRVHSYAFAGIQDLASTIWDQDRSVRRRLMKTVNGTLHSLRGAGPSSLSAFAEMKTEAEPLASELRLNAERLSLFRDALARLAPKNLGLNGGADWATDFLGECVVSANYIIYMDVPWTLEMRPGLDKEHD